MKNQMIVEGIEISYKKIKDSDYICLTDMAKIKPQESFLVISHWMRTRNTIDYLTAWESLYNPDFKPTEIGRFREECSLNSFTMTPQKWVENTNGISIFSKAGQNGGTWAHKDIAFKFASWLSVEFELFVIKEFQRLKEQEQAQLQWTAKRELAKINYHIHTDAIKENLIVPTLTERQKSFVYADEADLLNVALFGKTAKEWRNKKSKESLKGNIRDFATIHQLLVLANMESYNAILIKEKISQRERLVKLNEMARQQLKVLLAVDNKLLS
jgi:hypothetical protein